MIFSSNISLYFSNAVMQTILTTDMKSPNGKKALWGTLLEMEEKKNSRKSYPWKN